VDERRSKHLVLILARELASNLATPAAIADAEGMVVFFNEAAEVVVGEKFAEADSLTIEQWTARFDPRTFDAEPLPIEERPAGIALRERRPAHMRYLATSLDGVEQTVSVTAIPLFAHTDEFVGVMAIFWRDEE
jgi:PAS domain-containing protein